MAKMYVGNQEIDFDPHGLIALDPAIETFTEAAVPTEEWINLSQRVGREDSVVWGLGLAAGQAIIELDITDNHDAQSLRDALERFAKAAEPPISEEAMKKMFIKAGVVIAFQLSGRAELKTTDTL